MGRGTLVRGEPVNLFCSFGSGRVWGGGQGADPGAQVQTVKTAWKKPGPFGGEKGSGFKGLGKGGRRWWELGLFILRGTQFVFLFRLGGCGVYFVVADNNNRGGHPSEFGDGPMEAVDRFLSESDEFMIDQRCERFLLTLNPRGYLKRIKPRNVVSTNKRDNLRLP